MSQTAAVPSCIAQAGASKCNSLESQALENEQLLKFTAFTVHPLVGFPFITSLTRPIMMAVNGKPQRLTHKIVLRQFFGNSNLSMCGSQQDCWAVRKYSTTLWSHWRSDWKKLSEYNFQSKEVIGINNEDSKQLRSLQMPKGTQDECRAFQY